MTTTIVPSTGAGVLYTQQGVGTTPGYAALDDRRSTGGALQEGVYGTPTLVTAGGVANTPGADFMVTQRAAGANMSVDVNMPAGGFAYVQGDTINGQGLYTVPVHSANINEVIAAADPTNPRVDQVILEVQDNALDASGGNLARTRVLTGTPTGGATLTNRTGAVGLPGNALLLADVLVGNSVGSLANAVMRDRRKWARGASAAIRGNASGSHTTASTTFGSLAAGVYDVRLECSGVPLDIDFNGLTTHTVGGGAVVVQVSVDGGVSAIQVNSVSGTGSQQTVMESQATVTLAAGSHTFVVQWEIVTAGTGTLLNTGSTVPQFRYREAVRQNTTNNTVTVG